MKRSAASALELLLLILVAAEIVFRAILIRKLNIHWDEFHFLSQIYDLDRGGVESRFQTFYVWFFRWLIRLPGDEIGQILTGREIMFVLSLFSAVMTFLIGRLFFSRAAALFAVLAYQSASNILVHGSSFRYDPPLSAIFLFCVWLSLARERTLLTAVGVGLLFGVGAAINLKAGLLLGVLLLAVLADKRRGESLPKNLCWSVIAGSLTVPLFSLFTNWQSRFVIPPVVSIPAPSLRELISGFFAGGSPSVISFVQTLNENSLVWILFFSGTYLAMRRGLPILVAFASAILLVCLYRNAWPYFYVSILSPAILVIGGLLEGLLRADGCERRRTALAALLSIGIFSSAVLHFAQNNVDGVSGEREIIAEVHALFPQPVQYIDRAGMIGSFPKVGLFMSSYVMERYRKIGKPIFLDLLKHERPQLLLANSDALDSSRTPFANPFAIGLLDEDRKILSESFVRYWGPIFVPGVDAGRIGELEKTQNIYLPGTYMLQSECDVQVNGQSVHPGETVMLNENLTLRVPGGSECAAKLIWAAVAGHQAPHGPAPATIFSY